MENKNIEITNVINEIKTADEENLKKVIEEWFERTRTDGLKIGAQMVSTVVLNIIKTHTKKPGKTSLRDYERMTKDITDLLLVQMKKQKSNNEKEESSDDGSTEQDG